MPAKSTKKSKSGSDAVTHFETALNELESIVEKMESGELPLEDSLELFERGDQLAAQCRDILSKAELRIETLKAKSAAKNVESEDDAEELF